LLFMMGNDTYSTKHFIFTQNTDWTAHVHIHDKTPLIIRP
jgi:hypothetical protein